MLGLHLFLYVIMVRSKSGYFFVSEAKEVEGGTSGRLGR